MGLDGKGEDDAEIGENRGWMDLELEGDDGEIQNVIEYLRERDVEVTITEGEPGVGG